VIKSTLLVGLGGFVGTVLRYLIGRWTLEMNLTFPWGTFLVNIAGCLLIGCLAGLIERNQITSTLTAGILLSGFCGGFTTYSAFALEGFKYLKAQAYLSFLLYNFSTFLLCLAGVALGFWLTTRLFDIH